MEPDAPPFGTGRIICTNCFLPNLNCAPGYYSLNCLLFTSPNKPFHCIESQYQPQNDIYRSFLKPQKEASSLRSSNSGSDSNLLFMVVAIKFPYLKFRAFFKFLTAVQVFIVPVFYEPSLSSFIRQSTLRPVIVHRLPPHL